MSPMSLPRLPLSGIRILDFSHAAAGPYATMFLADLGAEVIKVERKGEGDPVRSFGSHMFGPMTTEYYVAINRNKQCVELDLGHPEGVRIAHQLAVLADIVVQNFRPGVADKLGIGFETLCKLRPGLVYASISGFGASGPWRDLPANDIIIQSASGLMGVTGEPDGPPQRIGASLCDFSSGLFMMGGVLAALFARDRFPEGQHVEVAMLDASFALLANFIPSVTTLGRKIPRPGRTHPQLVPYQALDCSDGKYVMVGAFTEAFWRRFAKMVGHPEWIDDPRFRTNARRLENRDALVPQIEAIFKSRTRDAWLVLLRQADVPASAIYEFHEAVRSEQAVHNKSILSLDQNGTEVGVVASPIRTGQWAESPAKAAPEMAADTRAVLRTLLGMSESEIDGLVQAGVAGEPRMAEKDLPVRSAV